MLHWRPMWGTPGKKDTRPPPSTSSSLMAVMDIGGAQQKTGVAVHQPHVAGNPCSLERPETQPCLCQVGQQLQKRDGASRHVAWWRVALPGTVPGPSNELHHSRAAKSPTSPPRQPGNSHTQRHLHQSRQHCRSPGWRGRGLG